MPSPVYERDGKWYWKHPQGPERGPYDSEKIAWDALRNYGLRNFGEN
jgi:hypothetical protein